MSRQMTGSLGLRNEPDKKGVSPDLKLIMSDNLPIVAIVAAYIAILYAVHAFFGIHGKIVLIPYFDVFTRLAIVISGIFLIPQVLKKSCRVYFQKNDQTCCHLHRGETFTAGQTDGSRGGYCTRYCRNCSGKTRGSTCRRSRSPRKPHTCSCLGKKTQPQIDALHHPAQYRWLP